MEKIKLVGGWRNFHASQILKVGKHIGVEDAECLVNLGGAVECTEPSRSLDDTLSSDKELDNLKSEIIKLSEQVKLKEKEISDLVKKAYVFGIRCLNLSKSDRKIYFNDNNSVNVDALGYLYNTKIKADELKPLDK